MASEAETALLPRRKTLPIKEALSLADRLGTRSTSIVLNAHRFGYDLSGLSGQGVGGRTNTASVVRRKETVGHWSYPCSLAYPCNTKPPSNMQVTANPRPTSVTNHSSTCGARLRRIMAIYIANRHTDAINADAREKRENPG
jgi:hypothetical protein